MRIENKRQFYRLWEEGVLGNRTQIFHTLQAAMDSRVEKIGFREMRAGGGTWERADRRDDVPAIHARWVAAGRRFIMDDGVPNDLTQMQGELCITTEGLEGFIAVRNGAPLPPMRISITKGMHRSYKRLEVRLLMEKFMDPSSRDDVDVLFELYPDHVIEFSTFDVNVGNLPRRNTIIWEVRAY